MGSFALSEAERVAWLATLLESAMDAIVTVDPGQRIVLFNRAAERIFGWSAQQALGRSVEMLLPPRLRTAAACARQLAAAGRGLRASGEEFPLEASLSRLETHDGELATLVVRDVSDRVQAQQELAAFAAEASSAREQEKARIARELHDELAQMLTALKMDVNWLRDHLDDRGAGAKLAQMQGLLDQAVGSTRRIAADLRPLVLDDLGLVAAIEWLAAGFTQRHGVACELRVDDGLQLQEPHATAIFRIVQESLANVAKHAQAHQVAVCLARDEREVLLRVQDDGAGFRLAEPRKASSLGLAGLRERARLLRGTLAIATAPGQGTCIEVRIPLERQAAAREAGRAR